jgi:hypothetical protein
MRVEPAERSGVLVAYVDDANRIETLLFNPDSLQFVILNQSGEDRGLLIGSGVEGAGHYIEELTAICQSNGYSPDLPLGHQAGYMSLALLSTLAKGVIPH